MNSLIDGILFVVVGIGLCVFSLRFHDGGPVALSPALFPVIVTLIIAALGGVLVFLEIERRRQTAGENETASPSFPSSPSPSASPSVTLEASNLTKMWLVFFLSLGYAFLLPRLHFIPSSLLYLAVFFFLTGERRWPVLAALSASTVVVVYSVFQKILGVLLP